MRLLVPAFRAAILPPECGIIPIQLLALSHSSFGTILVCDYNVDTTSNGNLYTAWGFELGLVDEIEGTFPNPSLIIDNTEASILLAIRNTAGSRERIAVTHSVVTYDAPNTLELPAVTYKVATIRGDANTLTASLVLALLTYESFPRYTASPSIWPGLFGAKSV